MTTTDSPRPNPGDHSDRLAELARRRQSSTDHKRAVIGKIVATGLTSTTVFGVTAALGLSARAENPTPTTPNTEQLVLDLATGRLITIQNGVPVSAQQVMAPGSADQTVTASAAGATAGTPTDSAAPLGAPLPSISSAKGVNAPATLAPQSPAPTPSTDVVVALAPPPTEAPTERLEVPIPVAVPVAPSPIQVPSQGSSSGS